jgi:hypothetical protein
MDGLLNKPSGIKIQGSIQEALAGSREYRADIKNFPQVWRPHFRQMPRRWAASAWIIEFGHSSSTRYAGEPESSRDCFETGEYAT